MTKSSGASTSGKRADEKVSHSVNENAIGYSRDVDRTSVGVVLHMNGPQMSMMDDLAANPVFSGLCGVFGGMLFFVLDFT